MTYHQAMTTLTFQVKHCRGAWDCPFLKQQRRLRKATVGAISPKLKPASIAVADQKAPVNYGRRFSLLNLKGRSLRCYLQKSFVRRTGQVRIGCRRYCFES